MTMLMWSDAQGKDPVPSATYQKRFSFPKPLDPRGLSMLQSCGFCDTHSGIELHFSWHSTEVVYIGLSWLDSHTHLTLPFNFQLFL